MTERVWPELVPFNGEAHAPTVPFPVDALPTKVRAFVSAQAGWFLCPPDLPATMLLGALSAACAGRVRLRVAIDWFEGANLYLVSVMPPSTNKSQVVKESFKAFDDEESALVERWTAEEAERTKTREVLKYEIAALKRRKADPANRARLTELLEQLAGVEPKPRPRLRVDDATPERLGVLMEQHGPQAIVSPEGRPFEHMCGLYKRAGDSDPDLYLKAWSGDPVNIARLSRPDVYIARPCLTLVMAIQPDAVSMLSKRPELRGRGLLARLMTSFPRSVVGARDWTRSRAIDPDARLRFNELVSRLLAIPRADPTAHVELAPDAKRVFDTYRADVEASMRDGDHLEESKDLGGKMPAHCARLALVLHMAEHGPSGLDCEVSIATMRSAIEIAKYFEAHTLATWDSLAGDARGAKVAEWLARGGRRQTTTRDVQRRFWREFRATLDARLMLCELAERGYVAPAGDDGVWDVSPRLSTASTNVHTKPWTANGMEKTGDSSSRAPLSTLSTASDETHDTREELSREEEEVVDSVDTTTSRASFPEKTGAKAVHGSAWTTVDSVDTHAFSDLIGEVAS